MPPSRNLADLYIPTPPPKSSKKPNPEAKSFIPADSASSKKKKNSGTKYTTQYERRVLEAQQMFQAWYPDDSLASWQRLCADLGLGGADELDSKRKCKKALKSVHINIYDFIQARTIETPVLVHRFRTNAELGTYTRENNLCFPREKAKEGPIRGLLGHLWGAKKG